MRDRLEDLGRVLEKIDQMLDKWPSYPDRSDKFVLYYTFEDPKDTVYAERLEMLYHELCALRSCAHDIYLIAKGDE